MQHLPIVVTLWLSTLCMAIPAAEAGADCDRRLVSLAPSLTELAFEAGAGDCLVGVVAWSDFPPAARKLPEIGDAFQFDLEKILSLDTGAVLAWTGGTPRAAVRRMEELGIEAVWIETRELDDIGDALVTIGRAAGRPESGQAAAAAFERGLAERRAARRIHPEPVRVFYQVSRRPLYTLGGPHVFDEMVRLCGGVNVFSGVDQEAFVVDLEAVLAADPEVIIAAREQQGGDLLSHWQAFPGLSAVASDQLHAVDATSLVRPSSGALEGIDKLCGLVNQARE